MPTTGATGYDSVSGASAPSASLTDFSLLVGFNPSDDWWSAFAAHDDPGRIRVSDTNDNEYARDVIFVSEALILLRVLWPGSQDSTPILRIWPDATGSYNDDDTFGRENAYDANWLAYYTFGDDPLGAPATLRDHTGNGHDGTKTGSGITAGIGVLGPQWEFSSAHDDGVELTSRPIAGQTALTCLAWCNFAIDSVDLDILVKGIHATNNPLVFWYDQNGSNDRLSLVITDADGHTTGVLASADGSMSADRHQVGFVFAGGVSTAFVVNGAITNTAAASTIDDIASSNTREFIGRNTNGSVQGFEGALQELQLHAVARSSAWIGYEYTITNDYSSFWSNSGWTAAGGGETPTGARRRRLIICGSY